MQQPAIADLPFLRALCWQVSPTQLQPEEVLAVYERGWHYRGVLADLSQIETAYIRLLAQTYQSWLLTDV